MILLLVLGAGAYYDIREHRIPNWWVLISMAAGMALCAIRANEAGAEGTLLVKEAWFLFRMFITVCLLFLLYICRMLGAGDIKLAALICGYLGLGQGAKAVFLGFLAGAVWSLGKLIARGTLMERIQCLAYYAHRVIVTKEMTAYYSVKRDGYGGTIPLGPCLLAGTVLSLVMGTWGTVAI